MNDDEIELTSREINQLLGGIVSPAGASNISNISSITASSSFSLKSSNDIINDLTLPNGLLRP